MAQSPIISLLGSCRLDSIKEHFRCTDLHEETSWPHYTKEMLQIIRCAKYGGISQDDAKYIFRKCILKYGSLDHAKIRNLYNSTDLFVFEIASRLTYMHNGFYLHHIASDAAYGDPSIIDKVKIGSMTDDEIAEDLKLIKSEIYPKKMVVVTHVSTYDGKRRALANLIVKTCKELDIPVLDPSILLQSDTIEQLFCKEAVISHYTPYGHLKVAPLYKNLIDGALAPRVAVILCGQVRNYWLALPHTVDNIIVPNNADVFCLVDHKYNDSTPRSVDKESLAKHISEIVGSNLKLCSFEDDFPETQKEHNALCSMLDPNNNEINRFGIIAQWIAKKIAFREFDKYALEKNITYDNVLILRPDVIYEPFKLPVGLGINDAYFTSRCGDMKCNWIMDNFYFGGYRAMKLIANFADYYGHLIFTECERCRIDSTYKNIMEVQFGLYLNSLTSQGINIKPMYYDIPSRRGERIPPMHQRADNRFNIEYPLKYVIDKVKLLA